MEESRDLDKYTQELLAAMFCIIRIEVVEGKIFVEGDKNKISIQRETQMRRRLNFLDNMAFHPCSMLFPCRVIYTFLVL